MAFLVYVVYHAYVFFKNVREDPNGDHSVDTWMGACHFVHNQPVLVHAVFLMVF